MARLCAYVASFVVTGNAILIADTYPLHALSLILADVAIYTYIRGTK